MLHCGFPWHHDQVLGVLPHVLNIKLGEQIKSSPRHAFHPRVALYHCYQRREKDIASFNTVMSVASWWRAPESCCLQLSAVRPVGQCEQGKAGKNGRVNKETADKPRLKDMTINVKLYSEELKEHIFKKNKTSNLGWGTCSLSSSSQYQNPSKSHLWRLDTPFSPAKGLLQHHPPAIALPIPHRAEPHVAICPPQPPFFLHKN